MSTAEASPAVAGERKVTTLELFFDLVFVFGITGVTAYLSDHHTALGFVQGALLLLLLWWAWTGYTWLGTTIDVNRGSVRLAMFAAMAGLLLVALGLPEWFGDASGGLSGPILVALAYVAVRVCHLVLFWLAARGVPELTKAVLQLLASTAVSAVILLVAAVVGGTWQLALVVLAVVLDYAGPLLGRGSGWVVSPGHFAERHGLIVIIALGESIVAIGVGAAGIPLSWEVVVASTLGIAVAARLWVLYFDPFAERLEAAMLRRVGAELARFALAVYSYLHVVLVAGIVLIALGLKSALAYVGKQGFDGHLPDYAAFALGLGIVLIVVMRQGALLRAGLRMEPGSWVALLLGAVLAILGASLPAVVAVAAAFVVLLVVGTGGRSPDAQIHSGTGGAGGQVSG